MKQHSRFESHTISTSKKDTKILQHTSQKGADQTVPTYLQIKIKINKPLLLQRESTINYSTINEKHGGV